MNSWTEPRVVAGRPGSLTLRAVAGPSPGLVLRSDDAELVVGREGPLGAGIRDDPSLSRRHAVFRAAGDAVVVEDLGSTNGTFVNDRRITGAVRVGPGDRIRVGATTLTIDTDPNATMALSAVAAAAAPAAPPPVPETAPPLAAPAASGVQRRWSDGESVLGVSSSVSERISVRGGANGGVSTVTTVRFRLDPVDGRAPMWVRFRASMLVGGVGNGELVEARGRRRGSEFRAREVYSHTTGDTLRAKWRGLELTLAVVVVLVLLALVGFMVLQASQSTGGMA